MKKISAKNIYVTPFQEGRLIVSLLTCKKKVLLRKVLRGGQNKNCNFRVVFLLKGVVDRH